MELQALLSRGEFAVEMTSAESREPNWEHSQAPVESDAQGFRRLHLLDAVEVSATGIVASTGEFSRRARRRATTFLDWRLFLFLHQITARCFAQVVRALLRSRQ